MHHCDTCGFESSVNHAYSVLEYWLANGLRIPVATSINWCHDCGDRRLVENLSMNDAQQKLSRLKQIVSALSPKPQRRWWQLHRYLFRQQWQNCLDTWDRDYWGAYERLANAQDHLTLIQHRQSAPRCLDCGGTHLDPLIEINTESQTLTCNKIWIHPSCGGKLLPIPDRYTARIMLIIRGYNSEGCLLEVLAPRGSNIFNTYFAQVSANNAEIHGTTAPKPLKNLFG